MTYKYRRLEKMEEDIKLAIAQAITRAAWARIPPKFIVLIQDKDGQRLRWINNMENQDAVKCLETCLDELKDQNDKWIPKVRSGQ